MNFVQLMLKKKPTRISLVFHLFISVEKHNKVFLYITFF